MSKKNNKKSLGSIYPNFIYRNRNYTADTTSADQLREWVRDNHPDATEEQIEAIVDRYNNVDQSESLFKGYSDNEELNNALHTSFYNYLTDGTNQLALGGTAPNYIQGNSNEFVEFNEGGTHEENPLGGVPISIDPSGNPNLVEEGESKHGDYVFSDRIKPQSLELLHQFGIKANPDDTFSDIAKKLTKEAEERPNDVIAQRGYRRKMEGLKQAQEYYKSLRANIDPTQQPTNIFSLGGTMLKAPSTFTDKLPIPALPSVASLPSALKSTSQGASSLAGLGIDTVTPYLRYAQPAMAGIGVLTDMLGITNTVDTSRADEIRQASQLNIPSYTPTLSTRYLDQTPTDPSYQINQARNTILGVNRQLGNTHHRASQLSGILASTANFTDSVGGMYRQALEQGEANRLRVAQYNAGIDAHNANLLAQAYQMNSANKTREAQMRQQGAVYATSAIEREQGLQSAGISSNRNAFLTALSNMGIEATNRNSANTSGVAYYSDWLGRNIYKHN